MPVKLDEILPCFFDMPVDDVARIVRVTKRTIVRCRKGMGIQKWPFEDVKKGTFKLNWKDIRELREEQLASAGDTVRPLLEAAQRRGDLMAKIHERNPPAPPKPARAPRAAQGEQLFDGVDFTDDFFRDEDLGELLEPAEAHHATQPQGEDDEPLQLDLEDAGSVYPFPDNSDDEAEWGLLGFGSPGP
jgi:hypothetical protein